MILGTRLDTSIEGFGGQQDELNSSEDSITTVTFSAQGGVPHGARHVDPPTDPAAVTGAIQSRITRTLYLNLQQNKDYSGTVVVDGTTYRYSWRYFGNQTANVGTFYPKS